MEAIRQSQKFGYLVSDYTASDVIRQNLKPIIRTICALRSAPYKSDRGKSPDSELAYTKLVMRVEQKRNGFHQTETRCYISFVSFCSTRNSQQLRT